jgi:redox-sensitive bicupin YhaK (pirin superfamily)
VTGAILRVLEGQPRDLGGFSVRRLLPSAGQRSVGPFVFFDHVGPARFPPGEGVDVRPHPHIGLATVTYLYEGEFMHRDSLGTAQLIAPGAVNWMVAGRGIVHSERTPAESRLAPGGSPLHGIQVWVALPLEHEEDEPSFEHHAAASLPELHLEHVVLRVIAGEAWGRRAAASVFSPMFYVDAAMGPGGRAELPREYTERAFYVAEGVVRADGREFGTGSMVVLSQGARLELQAPEAARVMLLGGEPLDAPRYLWWNFVSSSRERIEQARRDWREQRFAAVPGDPERIALPED